jgi:hypothetical protein
MPFFVSYLLEPSVLVKYCADLDLEVDVDKRAAISQQARPFQLLDS